MGRKVLLTAFQITVTGSTNQRLIVESKTVKTVALLSASHIRTMSAGRQILTDDMQIYHC